MSKMSSYGLQKHVEAKVKMLSEDNWTLSLLMSAVTVNFKTDGYEKGQRFGIGSSSMDWRRYRRESARRRYRSRAQRRSHSVQVIVNFAQRQFCMLSLLSFLLQSYLQTDQ